MVNEKMRVLKLALRLVLANEGCKHPDYNEPEISDLQDALEHHSGLGDIDLSIDDFDVSEVEYISIKDLSKYDDLSSWVEIGKGEFADEDDEEKRRIIHSFRKGYFADRAIKWINECRINPIVILETFDGISIGDGRGRVNIAVGMNWQKVPVIFLRER